MRSFVGCAAVLACGTLLASNDIMLTIDPDAKPIKDQRLSTGGTGVGYAGALVDEGHYNFDYFFVKHPDETWEIMKKGGAWVTREWSANDRWQERRAWFEAKTPEAKEIVRKRWGWDGSYDPNKVAFDFRKKHGIRTLLTLENYGVFTNLVTGGRSSDIKDVKRVILEFVQWIVDNGYKEQIIGFELGNEPYFGEDPENFAARWAEIVPEIKRIFPECHIGFTIAEYRAGDPDIAAVRARCSRVDEWFKGDTEFGFKKLNQWSGRFVNAFTNGIDHCSHCIYHFYGGDAAYGVGPSGFARIRNFAKIFPEVADKRIWITEWRERSDEDCRCQQMFSSTLFKAHYELQCLNDPIVDASSLHSITALSGGFCLASGSGRWYVQWDPAGRDFIDPDWTGHPRIEVGPAGPMFMLYNEALLGHPIILKHGSNLNQGPGSSCWNGSTFYGGWTSQMIDWHTRGEPEGGKPKWSSGGPEWIAAVNPEKNSLVLLICNTWTVPWRPSIDIPGFRVNGKVRQRTFSCPEEEVCLHQIPGEPRPTTLDDQQVEPDAINISPFGIATLEFNIERAAARVGLLGDASEDAALNAKAEAFFATNSIATILQAGENPGRVGGKDEPYGTFEIKGFTFITAPEFPDKAKYGELVADAVAKVGKERPVFLLQHRAPFGTTVRSTECDGYDHYKDDPKALTREFLDKYPNLIVLSGHNHTDVRDERAIWQGAFTAVNCGCLTRPDDAYVANPTPSPVCSNVLTLALFDDRATFTRYSLTSGQPVGRDWKVRWPFDAKSAPYRAEILTNRCEVGGFEGKVSVEAEERGGIKVSFPVGFANGYFAQTYRYRVELFLQELGEDLDPEEARFSKKNEKKEVKWIPVSLCDAPGNWICRDAPRAWWRKRESRTVTFSGALFAPKDQIKVVVTPESFAGIRGTPIEFTGKAPLLKLSKYEAVWSGGTCRPPASAFAGAAGTRFRVSFEFASESDARVDLEKAGGGKVKGGFTLPGLGVGELRRYALEFMKEAEGDAYVLVISKTLAEKASVSNVRVDRLVK